MALFRRQLRSEPVDQMAGPEDLYDQHLSWGEKNRSLRTLIGFILLLFALAGWTVAGVLSFSVAQLFPLVRTEVVPLIVDRNTGYMETVTTLDKDRATVSENQAVRAAFAGNYVIRRETYDPRYLSDNFDMIALWSEPGSQAFKDYEDWMNPPIPEAPSSCLVRPAKSGRRSSRSIRSIHRPCLFVSRHVNGVAVVTSLRVGRRPYATGRSTCPPATASASTIHSVLS